MIRTGLIVISLLIAGHRGAIASEGEFCKSLEAEPDAPTRLKKQGTFLYEACGDRATLDTWWMDDDRSEIGRVAYLVTCLRGDPAGGRIDEALARLVGFCLGDMRRVDKAAYEKEAASKAGTNEFGKSALAGMWTRMDERRTKWTAALEARANKDEDWKKLMDAAVAGYEGWYKDYAKHKDALDRARKFSHILETDNPKPAKGCAATMRKDLVDYVASTKPKTEAAFRAAMTDSIGYHLMKALARCSGVDNLGVEAYAMFYAPAVGSTHAASHAIKLDPQSGPRLAQYTAAMAALAQIKTDRPKFPVKNMGDFYGDPEIDTLKGEAFGKILSSVRSGKGVIDSLKPGKDGVVVKFKIKKYKQLDQECTNTNRIYKIHGDGTVEYHQDCKITGSHWETETTDPIVVPKELAGALKPGDFVEFLANRYDKPNFAMPVGIYKDSEKKKLVGYLWLRL